MVVKFAQTKRSGKLVKVFTAIIYFKVNITLRRHSLQSAWSAFQLDRGNLLGERFFTPNVTKAPIM